jgi:hypothetical protein
MIILAVHVCKVKPQNAEWSVQLSREAAAFSLLSQVDLSPEMMSDWYSHAPWAPPRGGSAPFWEHAPSFAVLHLFLDISGGPACLWLLIFDSNPNSCIYDQNQKVKIILVYFKSYSKSKCRQIFFFVTKETHRFREIQGKCIFEKVNIKQKLLWLIS